MTSEDWKTVLLALITTGGGAFATFCGVMLWWLKNKMEVAATMATNAAANAGDAKREMRNTQSLINGRMDDLLAAAKAKAFAEGVASVAKTMGDSPQIPVSQQQVLRAVAEASASAEAKPAAVSVVGPTGGK